MTLKKTNCFAARVFLISLLAVIISINLFANFSFDFNAFRFNLSTGFQPVGKTEIIIPPLGQVSARTHQLPVLLSLRLDNIDLNTLQKMMDLTDDFYLVFLEDIRQDLTFFIIQIILTAILAAVIATAIFCSTDKKTLFIAGLIAFIFISVNILSLVSVYDLDAFASPSYSGSLEAAPWMMGLISESLLRIEELSLKMQTMARNIYTVFEKIEQLDPLEPVQDGQLHLLHVSDIHNNVVAIDLIEQISHNFQVDLIIDTGDIVDYGTPVEAELISRISNLGVPYLFVPGNHDSPDIVNSLAARENIIILEDKFEFRGLQIVGVFDPLAFKGKFYAPDRQQVEAKIKKLETMVAESEIPAHIIAVHNHQIARAMDGLAPLVFYGHTHRKEITQTASSILINAGTTGASGIRGLETTAGTPPYTMVLLRLREEEGEYFLRAIDTIEIKDINQGFILTRYLKNRKLFIEQ